MSSVEAPRDQRSQLRAVRTLEPSTRPFRFTPPEPLRDMLLRPRLLATLARRFEHRVTVVEGAAGFGKTTLLAQAVHENALAPRGRDVWLTAEPDDESAEMLGAALCEAIGARGVPRPGHRDVVRVIADALWQESPQHVALIIDDAHEIPAESSGSGLLGTLAAAMPENAHLVLATRGPRPFPTTRLLAHGAVLEISESELAFSDDEVESFASLRAVRPGALASAGGWPALIELAAVAGPERGVEFLAEEVLSAMTRERRRVLATVTVLGGADDEIATEAMGAAVDLGDVLDGVPLIVQGANGWRSPHPLWRECLEGELDEDEGADACQRAAPVLARRGDLAGAFRLFATAAAWRQALTLMRDSCAIVQPPPIDVMRHWLRTVPTDLQQEPEVVLVRGAVEMLEDRDRARTMFEDAAQAFRARADRAGEFCALVQMGDLAIWCDDQKSLLFVAARALELETAGVEGARQLASLARATVAQMIGDDRAALDELDSIDTRPLNGEWLAIIAFFRAYSLLYLGDAEAAVDQARQADLLSGPIFHELPAFARLLGTAAITDVTEQLPALRALADSYKMYGEWRILLILTVHLSLIEAYTGDVTAARAHASLVAEAAPREPGAWVALAAGLTRAAIAVAEGNEHDAAAILHDDIAARPLSDPHHARHHRMWLALTYVLVPSTRSFWDADTLSPRFATTLRMARALLTVRDRGDLSVMRGFEWPDDELRLRMPAMWLAELSAAGVAADDPAARVVIDRLGPTGRSALRRLRDNPGPVGAAARQLLSEAPSAPEHDLDLRLLGPVELRRDGALVDDRDWRRERVRSLLAYVVAHPASTRDAVAEALWPEADMEASSRNLRVNLTHLQRVLEPSREEREQPFFLRQQGTMLTLTDDPHLRLDVREFERLLDAAASAEVDGVPSLALEHLLAALDAYRGDYLADAPWAEWIAPERDRLRAHFVGAAVRAGELQLARGEVSEAIALAARAIDADPWSEPAQRLAVAAHLAAGDRSAARRAMDRCRAMLAELGVDPEVETLMLERRLAS